MSILPEQQPWGRGIAVVHGQAGTWLLLLAATRPPFYLLNHPLPDRLAGGPLGLRATFLQIQVTHGLVPQGWLASNAFFPPREPRPKMLEHGPIVSCDRCNRNGRQKFTAGVKLAETTRMASDAILGINALMAEKEL